MALRVDVYIGFMDEEVFYTIRAMLNRAEQSEKGKFYNKLYAIERGRKESISGILFERDISRYNTETKKLTSFAAYDPSESSKAGGDAVLKNLLSGLSSQLIANGFVSRKLIGRTGAAAGTKTMLSPSLTVIDFSSQMVAAPDSDDNVAIVVRSPEMGGEASLVRPFLRGIIKSMAHLNGATQDVSEISLYMVAAGGSCDPGNPGETWEIDSSVYVGPRIEQIDDERSAVYTAVEFVRVDRLIENDIYEILYKKYCGKLSGDEEQNTGVIDAARTEAQKVLWRQFFAADNKISIPYGDKTLEIVGGPHEALKALCSGDLSTRKTSLSGGFFLYSDDKIVANSLGLHDVNMEDYHILRIVRSLRKEMLLDTQKMLTGRQYPDLSDFIVKRIDCDPYHIEDLAAFNEWYNSKGGKQVAFGHMKSLIEFGLDGLPFDSVNGSNLGKYDYLNWVFVAQMARGELGQPEWTSIIQELNKRFVYWPGNETNPLNQTLEKIFVPDPLRLEVATDLLKDARNRKAVKATQDQGKNALINVLCECASRLLSQGAGGNISNFSSLIKGNDTLKAICEKQTNQLDKFGTEQENSRASLIEIFVTALFKYYGAAAKGEQGSYAESDTATLWLRSKWKLDPTTTVKWSVDNIDRLYYKASNMAGLKKINDSLVTGLAFTTTD